MRSRDDHQRNGLIDVHHHVIPEFYVRAMERAGLDNPIRNVDYPAWSVEASLSAMHRHGVTTAIVSITDPGVQFADQATATALAREINDYFADLIRANPLSFGAFAVLPLPDVDAALAELDYAVDNLQLDGVGLLSNYRGIYLGHPSFEPLFAELERRSVPVFVHPATPPSKDQPTFDLPPSLYEYTFDTTRTVVSLLYNGIFEKHPRLRIILAHGGGNIPYIAKRLTYGPVINSRLGDRAPADVIADLRRCYYDLALVANDHALPSLQALSDPSRILFGSDFPFMPEWHLAEAAAKVSEYPGFNCSERELIAYGNAQQLFPRLAHVQ